MIGNVGGARPAYHDRTPLAITQQYSATAVAPHASTTRWTYTVPTGRKFFCQVTFARWVRATAAAPVGNANVLFSYTPNGGVNAVTQEAVGAQNGVGLGKETLLGVQGSLGPGDAVAGGTSDASTGGTIDYRVSMAGIEFDA